jgi:hypothetical protein
LTKAIKSPLTFVEDCQDVSAKELFIMSSNSTDTPKSISNVVSNHADRVMDELFADIEGLLSGETSERHSALNSNKTTAQNSPQQPANPTYPQLPPDLRVSGEAPETAIPETTVLAAPKKHTWRNVLIGLGVVAIATGGGVWWLVRQGKINLARVQLPSLNSAPNGDVQFSDYLRRAMGKVESKATPGNQVSIPNPPAQEALPPTAQQQPAGAFAVSLARIIPGSPPMVEFSIGGKLQQFRGGDKIGASGWTLTTVINTVDNEVIVKRDNGEMRSLKLGQGF